MPITLTAAKHRQILDDGQKGLRVSEIARKHKLPYHTVYKLFKQPKHDTQPTNGTTPPKQANEDTVRISSGDMRRITRRFPRRPGESPGAFVRRVALNAAETVAPSASPPKGMPAADPMPTLIKVVVSFEPTTLKFLHLVVDGEDDNPPPMPEQAQTEAPEVAQAPEPEPIPSEEMPANVDAQGE